MALVEKLCRHCETFFYYDDGVDSGGLANSTDRYKRDSECQQKRRGFCPKCDDPHYIPGETYQKDVIIQLFKKHLSSKGVNVAPFDKEILVSMMKSFTRTYALYSSNGTFRTFNLLTGSRFKSEWGEFELLAPIPEKTGPDTFAYKRGIKCLRCGKVIYVDRKKALEFFIGLHEKSCINCDNNRINNLPDHSDHERNTNGLNRNGSSKSEFSDRAMAKALNVSRNDYRRYHITERVEPLATGTIVNGLTVTEAFWDEDPSSYSPKYVLVCMKCKKTFVCLQKKVQNYQHFC
jgi:hypothetical protein